MNILTLIPMIYEIISKPKEGWELVTFYKDRLTDLWSYGAAILGGGGAAILG